MHHFGFRLIEYIRYRLSAKGPHSLHSPFLFSLYREVLKPARKFRIKDIEKLRRQLLRSPELVEVIDFKSGKSELKAVTEIARESTSTRRFSTFLLLLANKLKVKTILETGTSLGINTLYLSQSTAEKVITIEGSRIIAKLAEHNFKQLRAEKIKLINDNFYKILEQEIVRSKPDFFFLDADHRSSSIVFCIDLILKHTPNTKCIVVHDIYWSPDMKDIWNELKQDPRFPLTIDLYQGGILFLNLEMPKQHFTLHF